MNSENDSQYIYFDTVDQRQCVAQLKKSHNSNQINNNKEVLNEDFNANTYIALLNDIPDIPEQINKIFGNFGGFTLCKEDFGDKEKDEAENSYFLKQGQIMDYNSMTRILKKKDIEGVFHSFINDLFNKYYLKHKDLDKIRTILTNIETEMQNILATKYPNIVIEPNGIEMNKCREIIIEEYKQNKDRFFEKYLNLNAIQQNANAQNNVQNNNNNTIAVEHAQNHKPDNAFIYALQREARIRKAKKEEEEQQHQQMVKQVETERQEYIERVMKAIKLKNKNKKQNHAPIWLQKLKKEEQRRREMQVQSIQQERINIERKVERQQIQQQIKKQLEEQQRYIREKEIQEKLRQQYVIRMKNSKGLQPDNQRERKMKLQEEMVRLFEDEKLKKEKEAKMIIEEMKKKEKIKKQVQNYIKARKQLLEQNKSNKINIQLNELKTKEQEYKKKIAKINKPDKQLKEKVQNTIKERMRLLTENKKIFNGKFFKKTKNNAINIKKNSNQIGK